MTKKPKTRRPSMGSNPLDALVGGPAQPDAAAAPAAPRAARRAVAANPDARVRVTLYARPALLDEARRAVVALAGLPLRLTLASLLDSALEEKLARLNKSHYSGKPWPPLDAPLKGGRPMTRRRTSHKV